MTRPRQNSIFGNLPGLTENQRELNKQIVKKANNPQRQTTTRVRSTETGAGANASLINKIQLSVELAKQRLINDGTKEVIRSEERFRAYMKDLRRIALENDRVVGIDGETTGLDPIDDHLVGLAFYVRNDEGLRPCYVPMKHTDYYGNELKNQISYEVMREELLECVRAGIKFVYHNAKFDIRFIRNSLKVFITVFWCTQLGSNFLNEEESHQLKPLHDKYIMRGAVESDTFADLFKGIPFNYVPPEIGGVYAAGDPLKTVDLAEFQFEYLTETAAKCMRQSLEGAARLMRNVEVPLIPIIADMEDIGICIDVEMAAELSKKYNALKKVAADKCNTFISKMDLSVLPNELFKILSNPVNLNSPKQLAVIFYDLLGMVSTDKRKPRGTGEEIIQGLAAKYKQYKEFFDDFLEYRGIAKLLSTYIDKIPQLVKDKTGRLHGQFNQYGAKTGRFSSEGPNLQNIPSKNKEIRKIFIPSVGMAFIGGDFSQQEPRALAELCLKLFGDRKMIDAYLSGRDLYSWMAAEVYGTTYEECLEFRLDENGEKVTYKEGKARRSSVKDILLGLMYGRTTESVAEKMGVTVEEAQRIVDMLFDTFPAIQKVMEYYWKMVREKGYVQTIWGRKRRIPNYNLPKYEFVYASDKSKHIDDPAVREYYELRLAQVNSGKAKRAIFEEANARGIWIVDNTLKIQEAERQILNSVIQGTGADITKIAMVLVGQDRQLKEWGFRLLLTIHDEIIGEAPEENALKCAERMQELMLQTTVGMMEVPMSVDCEITRRWTGEDVTAELKHKYAA